MSSGPIITPKHTPTNAGEDPQTGPQGRERLLWESPADPPAGGWRTEDALPRRTLSVSCNAIPRARQDAVAEDLGMVRRWDLIAVPIGLSSEASGRATPDPRVVVPAGMSGALQPSAPASSPPPRGATRSCRTARAQASSGPDDCRFGRRDAAVAVESFGWHAGWHAPTSGV